MGPDPSPLVSIQRLVKRFGAFTALADIDLDVREGEVLTLLGPSGCGKTTLMRIVAGFESPTEGRLLLRGADMARLPPERRPVNMVFQRYALFPHLDVFDNVAFGLRLKRMPEAEVRARVGAMIALVQLDGMASRWITEISGGQAQRVALARALVNEPAVLLLDEPLAALDLKIRHVMLDELKRIQRETGTTFVYVTHDQDEAMILSNRIALMQAGRIEQLGTPDDLYARPRTLFAARFLGETNIIEGRVAGRDGSALVVEAAGGRWAVPSNPGLAAGAAVHLSVRPEAVRLGPAGGAGLAGTVRDRSRIGGRVVYDVVLRDGTALRAQELRTPDGAGPAPGEAVAVSWDPAAVSVLRA